MARQTSFPGVLVESIRVEKPPFDEKGVIQEFVGRGMTREFPSPEMDLTPDQVEDVIDSASELIGPLRDTFKMRYNLVVRSVPFKRVERVKERSISTRARAYVRVKNPFEPDIIKVGEPSRAKEFEEEESITGLPPAHFFRIPVWVTK